MNYVKKISALLFVFSPLYFHSFYAIENNKSPIKAFSERIVKTTYNHPIFTTLVAVGLTAKAKPNLLKKCISYAKKHPYKATVATTFGLPAVIFTQCSLSHGILHALDIEHEKIHDWSIHWNMNGYIVDNAYGKPGYGLPGGSINMISGNCKASCGTSYAPHIKTWKIKCIT